MSDYKKAAAVGGIQKFSTEDGPGIRTTVFLKGCPLNCRWCHNPELIEYGKQLILMPNRCVKCGYCLEHCPDGAIFLDSEQKVSIDRAKCNLCMECTKFCYAQSIKSVATEMTAEEIMKEVIQDKGFYEYTEGGMTVSGGEMLTHPQIVNELITIAESENIGVCLDTSGYGDGDTLLELSKRAAVTNVLFDMKSIDDEVHIAYTGVSNELILKNLRLLAADSEVNPKILMRMPLIKGVNDTEEIINKTCALYKELGIKKVTLLPYHNLGVSKKKNIGGKAEFFEATTEERVAEIQQIFETHAGMTTEVLGKI